MKVAVLCEFSGVVRDAFINAGHDAISCDLFPTEAEGPHIQDDCRNHNWEGFDLIIGHPPCTFITNAGVRWLHEHVTSRNGKRPEIYGEARWSAMKEACEFFNWIKGLPCDRIAIENPIPHKYARELIGPYTQIIQPWMFGHEEMKSTCLWLKGLPALVPTNIVGPPPKDKEQRKRWMKVHYASPGPDRWKIRSRTFSGIADGMVAQWN